MMSSMFPKVYYFGDHVESEPEGDQDIKGDVKCQRLTLYKIPKSCLCYQSFFESEKSEVDAFFIDTKRVEEERTPLTEYVSISFHS